MGRTASQSTVLTQPALIGPNEAREIDRQGAELVQALGEEHVRATAARALAEQLAYDGELTIPALVDGVRLYQRRTVEDCLGLGKCLLLLQELADHGTWLPTLAALGFAERTAQRFMMAAFKTSKSANLADISRRAGSASKMLELLVLDDDEAGDLLGGKSISGLTMDDVDTMTASALRRALREIRSERDEARRDYEAASALLGQSKAKIRRMEGGDLRPLRLDQQMAEWPAGCGALIGEIRRHLTQIGLIIQSAEKLPIPDRDTPEADIHSRAMRLLFDSLSAPLNDLSGEVLGVENHLNRIVGAFAYPADDAPVQGTLA